MPAVAEAESFDDQVVDRSAGPAGSVKEVTVGRGFPPGALPPTSEAYSIAARATPRVCSVTSPIRSSGSHYGGGERTHVGRAWARSLALERETARQAFQQTKELVEQTDQRPLGVDPTPWRSAVMKRSLYR